METLPDSVKPIEPFGAEVDLDLRDSENKEPLQALFETYGLLVFRNQSLTLDDQRRVMGYLGPVLEDWTSVGYVSNVREDGVLGNDELSFHLEMGATPKPFLGLSLHALDVEYEASATRFASAARALSNLAAGTRERLRGLRIVNLFPVGETALATRQRADNYPDDAPKAVHPIVTTDPITKSQVLVANQMMTDQIIGLEEDDSETLLGEVCGQLYAPDNIYEHLWRNGDIVIWSNYAVHHARSALRPTSGRTLQRVCITDGTPDVYSYPATRRKPKVLN